jgi:hypothetical protein
MHIFLTHIFPDFVTVSYLQFRDFFLVLYTATAHGCKSNTKKRATAVSEPQACYTPCCTYATAGLTRPATYECCSSVSQDRERSLDLTLRLYTLHRSLSPKDRTEPRVSAPLTRPRRLTAEQSSTLFDASVSGVPLQAFM